MELTGRNDDKKQYLSLVTATDTKIIRFKKIVGKANPYDEKWDRYFEERDGERMLNSTKGRDRLMATAEKLLQSLPAAEALLFRKRVKG